MAKSVQTASVIIPADIRFVASVRAFAYEFMKQVGAGEKHARRTEFIVGELCANAIEHGRSISATVKLRLTLEGDSTVRIECVNTSKDTSITSQDLVQKFHQDVDAASKRGRGLYVIRQWTQDAFIEDIDGGLRISVVQSF